MYCEKWIIRNPLWDTYRQLNMQYCDCRLIRSDKWQRTGVLFTDVIFTYFTPVVINNINNCTDCWKSSLSLFVEGRTTIYIVTDPQKTGPIARKLPRFILFLWYYYYYVLTHWGWQCWVSLDVQSEVTRINLFNHLAVFGRGVTDVCSSIDVVDDRRRRRVPTTACDVLKTIVD